MKKSMQILFAFVALFLVSIQANSQTTADFFIGKWNVVVSGTPSGDSKMIVNLVSENGKLTGTIDAGMGESVKLTNVELSGNAVTLYFSANGYDINLTLEKKDENHVVGNMMGMFDAKGERIEE